MSKDTDARARAATEFNKLIQEGRIKKKNEQLAAKIFGQKPLGGNRNPAAAPRSLASRVGIQKRYATRHSSLPIANRTAAANRSESAFHRSNRAVRGVDAAGFNVRGMGMTVVVAQNFAPGTNAADIRAVFAPDKSQGLSSCRIVTASPTIIAELVFQSQDEAEVVVAKFNNKMADGRRLYVYLQKNPAIVQAKPDLDVQEKWLPNDQEMEVERESSKAYSAAGASGTELGGSRPGPIYEDGKYGFGNHETRRGYDDGKYSGRSRDQQGGLVSDGMMQNYYSQDRRQHGRR